jgi:hypothetical protein
MSGASPGVTKVGLAGWGGPSSQLRTLGSLATLLSHCERIPRQVDPSQGISERQREQRRLVLLATDPARCLEHGQAGYGPGGVQAVGALTLTRR